MCGVIAYRSAKPEPKDFMLLARLFEESAVRGIHSFGVSWLPESGPIKTAKFPSADRLAQFIAVDLSQERPKALIGHNRYSTSGDWLDNRNNQPLYLPEANLAMAFNGVIDQSPETEWPERYGYRFATENDGEIALRKFSESPDRFLDWFQKQSFSFAGAFLDENGVRLIRNKSRPLWCAKTENGTHFVASTVDILRRSGINATAFAVPLNSLVRI